MVTVQAVRLVNRNTRVGNTVPDDRIESAVDLTFHLLRQRVSIVLKCLNTAGSNVFDVSQSLAGILGSLSLHVDLHVEPRVGRSIKVGFSTFQVSTNTIVLFLNR